MAETTEGAEDEEEGNVWDGEEKARQLAAETAELAKERERLTAELSATARREQQLRMEAKLELAAIIKRGRTKLKEEKKDLGGRRVR